MTPGSSVSRRDVLKAMGVGAALLGLGIKSSPAASVRPAAMPQPFTLPVLPYAYAALEPHIDARTMEIHHTKHHQGYIANANKVLADHPELHGLDAGTLLRRLDSLPENIRPTVRNQVGGHHNHALFWRVIKPQAGGVPDGRLDEAIRRDFGSFDTFKTVFTDTAMRRFGSGWTWLSLRGNSLAVHSTANQDSPLIESATPLLGIDLWEHAYYLHYQNRRADYVAAFWRIINWDQVQANLEAALVN